MEVCILQGQKVTPEMPGICGTCTLYLNTCLPQIEYSYISGAECDYCYYIMKTKTEMVFWILMRVIARSLSHTL